jgi:hypothetical protein
MCYLFLSPPRTSSGRPPTCVFVTAEQARRYLATSVLSYSSEYSEAVGWVSGRGLAVRSHRKLFNLNKPRPLPVTSFPVNRLNYAIIRHMTYSVKATDQFLLDLRTLFQLRDYTSRQRMRWEGHKFWVDKHLGGGNCDLFQAHLGIRFVRRSEITKDFSQDSLDLAEIGTAYNCRAFTTHHPMRSGSIKILTGCLKGERGEARSGLCSTLGL